MQIDDAQLSLEPAHGAVLDEPLLTADQVAAALGVHRKFVYARHHSGALRGYKIGPHYRFRPSDVRAFLEASVAPADAPPEPRVPQRRSASAGTFRSLIEGRAA